MNNKWNKTRQTILLKQVRRNVSKSNGNIHIYSAPYWKRFYVIWPNPTRPHKGSKFGFKFGFGFNPKFLLNQISNKFWVGVRGQGPNSVKLVLWVKALKGLGQFGTGWSGKSMWGKSLTCSAGPVKICTRVIKPWDLTRSFAACLVLPVVCKLSWNPRQQFWERKTQKCQ